MSAGPELFDGVQQRVLDTLRRDGIVLVSFEELFDDESLWQALSDDIGAFARETEQQLDEPRKAVKGKSFIARRYLGSKETPVFDLDNPWLRLGLFDRLLDVVNAYRGEPVHLIDFDNWYTIPDPTAETRVKSQQWHRDPWDEHITKVFVYFSDVDEDAGPFEYVPQSAPGEQYGDLWPWQPEGVYPPQDEFEATIPSTEWLSATGPAGTVIICDTSGFHRGGWARLRPRILSTQTYVGSTSAKRPRFELGASAENGGLSPAACAALSWSLDSA
jgi:Phytanoyl-CoA dioxygenase (PhyH)